MNRFSVFCGYLGQLSLLTLEVSERFDISSCMKWYSLFNQYAFVRCSSITSPNNDIRQNLMIVWVNMRFWMVYHALLSAHPSKPTQTTHILLK